MAHEIHYITCYQYKIQFALVSKFIGYMYKLPEVLNFPITFFFTKEAILFLFF